MTRFQNSTDIRVQLINEIRDAASRRHHEAIGSLTTWYATGCQGDEPEISGIGAKALEALIDDLDWIYQEKLQDGWLPSVYERQYVKLRRAAKRSAAENHRGNGPKVLRDLLPKF